MSKFLFCVFRHFKAVSEDESSDSESGEDDDDNDEDDEGEEDEEGDDDEGSSEEEEEENDGKFKGNKTLYYELFNAVRSSKIDGRSAIDPFVRLPNRRYGSFYIQALVESL